MKYLSLVSSRKNAKRIARPACLTCLIKQQKWRKVIKIIAFNKNESNHNPIARSCGNICCSLKLHPTILHYSCKFQPSLQAVEALLAADPKATSQLNIMNQYPLHIACKHRATSEVIEYLLQKYPQAAMAQDIDGNIPLHLGFIGCYEESANDKMNFEVESNLRRCIKILCEIEPMSVLVRNERGMRALDQASILIADVWSIHVIRILTICAERGESGACWVSGIGPTLKMQNHRKAKIIPV